jgi:hypothetical protein
MIKMGKGIIEVIHGSDAALFASRSLAKRAACPVNPHLDWFTKRTGYVSAASR